MTEDLRKVRTLAIELHGRRVGVINRLGGDRHLFTFEEAYLEDPLRPTLSLSFKGDGGELIAPRRTYGVKVPPFFSNLLPEGHLRTYLSGRIGVKPEREFFLLAALGSDLPGAVVAKPVDAVHDEPEPPDVAAKTGEEASGDIMRFSLAGVQLKFSAILEAGGGLTIPADGANGSWIVKLPSTRFPAVPENEFVMLSLAAAIGIEVPEHRLVPVTEIAGLPREAANMSGNALAVRRFDRGPAGERIHMEDFAQVFGQFPSGKYSRFSYANIVAVLVAEAGHEAALEFVRRLVFSVVIGNGDMHLKNWSLLYQDGRTPSLSPAYDFVSTAPYIEGDRFALSFGGSRDLSGVTKEQLSHFAIKAGMPVLPVLDTAIEVIARTQEAWRDISVRDCLQPDLGQRIGETVEVTELTE